MKNRRAIYKFKFYTIIIIVSLVFSLISILFTYSNSNAKYNNRDYYYEYYIVKSNDTIWNIAVKFNTFKIDIRDFVDIIIKENDIEESVIIPGEKLKIPII